MNNIKLTKVFENEYGIHVMVKSSAFIKINESEFFLLLNLLSEKESDVKMILNL